MRAWTPRMQLYAIFIGKTRQSAHPSKKAEFNVNCSSTGLVQMFLFDWVGKSPHSGLLLTSGDCPGLENTRHIILVYPQTPARFQQPRQPLGYFWISTARLILLQTQARCGLWLVGRKPHWNTAAQKHAIFFLWLEMEWVYQRMGQCWFQYGFGINSLAHRAVLRHTWIPSAPHTPRGPTRNGPACTYP